jgi:hypothetical protein
MILTQVDGLPDKSRTAENVAILLSQASWHKMKKQMLCMTKTHGFGQ